MSDYIKVYRESLSRDALHWLVLPFAGKRLVTVCTRDCRALSGGFVSRMKRCAVKFRCQRCQWLYDNPIEKVDHKQEVLFDE